MINEIQQKVLTRLINKYEKSKTFTGENKINQSFSMDINKMYPDYMDSSEYELHKKIDESLEYLAQEGLISYTKKKNELIEKVILNLENINKVYEVLNRHPRKDIQAELNSILDSINTYKESPLFYYLQSQKERLQKNQEVEYFKGDFSDYQDLLKAVNAIQNNEVEVLIRTLSVNLFNNSKKLEALQNDIESILFKYGEFESKETVFAECGVMNTPTTVKIKGNAIINIAEQKLDLSKIGGDIEFSTKTMKEIKSIRILGSRIVSIENLTTFYEYENKEDFQIYLGGFHNTTKREFLKNVYSQNPDKKYLHFGDIDAGGFYIFLHLCEKTGIPFESYNMDVNTLRKYKNQVQELSQNDRKRLQMLLEKQECSFGDTIEYMLKNNCKLEQENIDEL